MDRFFRYKLDHILFWSLTIFFHGYTRLWLIGKADFTQFLIEVTFRNALLATIIYINLLVILPRFMDTKKYLAGVLFMLLLLISYAALKSIHDEYLYGTILGELPKRAPEAQFFYNLSIVIFYFIFATTLHLSKQWYLQRELIRKIEVEKITTELEYLKAQINPHFLFNSINTIYFQIDKQNISARETLSKFSDMLRYQLYECNGHEIPVEKEISYLKNYVELQKLRKDENYSIEFSCPDELKNFSLPPLLLVPFVENAFKHVSHFMDKKNVIKIELSKTGNLFRLSVFNTKDDAQRASENGGIGLKNVKRRLELLYKDRYLLDVVNASEKFEVNLELKITPR
ncbi:MAG TPA: histidine kinase [Cyclobacteriaceae bacterium]|nr:histidine kinase [Cyclobacteriaceae bacterium]